MRNESLKTRYNCCCCCCSFIDVTVVQLQTFSLYSLRYFSWL